LSGANGKYCSIDQSANFLRFVSVQAHPKYLTKSL
jgi:hypothetical protein